MAERNSQIMRQFQKQEPQNAENNQVKNQRRRVIKNRGMSDDRVDKTLNPYLTTYQNSFILKDFKKARGNSEYEEQNKFKVPQINQKEDNQLQRSSSVKKIDSLDQNLIPTSLPRINPITPAQEPESPKKCQNKQVQFETPEKEKEIEYIDYEVLLNILPKTILQNKTINLEKFVEENPGYIDHLLKKCECYTCTCGSEKCKCDWQKQQTKFNLSTIMTRYAQDYASQQNIPGINSKYELSLSNYESQPYLKDKERVARPISITQHDFLQLKELQLQKKANIPNNLIIDPLKKQEYRETHYNQNYPNYHIKQKREYMTGPVNQTWKQTNFEILPSNYKKTYQQPFKNYNAFPVEDNKKLIGPLSKSYTYDTKLEEFQKKQTLQLAKSYKLLKATRDDQTIEDHHKVYNFQSSGIPGFEGQYKTNNVKTFDLKVTNKCDSQVKNQQKRIQFLKQLEEKNFAMKYIEYDVGKNVKTME